jgi:hypothetical protein
MHRLLTTYEQLSISSVPIHRNVAIMYSMIREEEEEERRKTNKRSFRKSSELSLTRKRRIILWLGFITAPCCGQPSVYSAFGGRATLFLYRSIFTYGVYTLYCGRRPAFSSLSTCVEQIAVSPAGRINSPTPPPLFPLNYARSRKDRYGHCPRRRAIFLYFILFLFSYASTSQSGKSQNTNNNY